jgi:hypothetical protein
MKIDVVLSWYSMSYAAARVKKGFFCSTGCQLAVLQKKRGDGYLVKQVD